MPKGTRRASYVRDGRGRFASAPGAGAPKRPPAKKAGRGTNRLTRDNSGRITGVGGNGATARGGRLRTGAGNLRARQTDRLKGAPQGVLSRGGKVRGKARGKAETFNETLKKANPAAYEKLQKREAKVAKAQQRKAAKLATRNGASAPSGDAGARARRSARLSGVSGRIAGRARRVYAQQGERVGAGTLPNRGLFAAPMGRRSTGTNAATSGLQPGKKARGARPTGTIVKPRGMKPGALKASRIARGRANRAVEPLGTRLNRVYIRTKAIEARNDPRTLRGKNTRRNDKSFGIARKASSFLGKGDKAWTDRARLSTGRRSGATSGLQPGRKVTVKVKRTFAPKRVLVGRQQGTIAKPRGMKPGALATKAARSRAASAGRKGAAAKKPVGWMQSPEARKDRVDPMSAANRKDYARRLRAVPKAAQRAIQVERSARKRKFLVAGNTAAQLTNLSEGRMQLIANVGKRKNKLTPGQIDAITRTMSESARRLKVGMAMGGRGRMKYNPKALQLAPSTAARKIRGARVGGTGVAKGKPTGKAAIISREQFVGRQGSGTTSMGEAIASASPGGRTRMSKKQEGRMIATAERQMSAIRAKDQKAGALYDALARAGRVKPPRAENRIARLTRAAQGYPELESAKAAQRLLAKRAAKPAAPKRVTAGRQRGTIAKTTRAGLKLGKNADGRFAWFSRDGKQQTGAYKTKNEAQKSPEIQAKEQILRNKNKIRAKGTTKARMSQKDYQNADSKWGGLSDSQIEKMIQRDTSAARSLQNNREFTGNNTRRYGPAMANQGAVEAFESARQAGRYLSERRARKQVKP